MIAPPRPAAFTPYDLILFDLDGVITTEHIYWECARLTIWELLHLRLQAAKAYVPAVHDPAAREGILPLDLIFALKERVVNSNWDITFVASCALLKALEGGIQAEGTSPGARDILELLYAIRATAHKKADWTDALADLLVAAGERQGPDLIAYAGQVAGEAIEVGPDFFKPGGPWWQYLYERFQLWFTGVLMGTWGAAPLQEKLTLPVEAILKTLQTLRDAGCILGIVTGRPRDEALPPLRTFGLLNFFAAERIATYTEAQVAQQESGLESLGKPHPFSLRRALHPDASTEDLLGDKTLSTGLRALVVGDAPGDALMAQAVGVPCVGVLSGVIGEAARETRRVALLEAGCVAILDDLTGLPGWLGLT